MTLRDRSEDLGRDQSSFWVAPQKLRFCADDLSRREVKHRLVLDDELVFDHSFIKIRSQTIFFADCRFDLFAEKVDLQTGTRSVRRRLLLGILAVDGEQSSSDAGGDGDLDSSDHKWSVKNLCELSPQNGRPSDLLEVRLDDYERVLACRRHGVGGPKAVLQPDCGSTEQLIDGPGSR